jgi:hypothetical protein
MPTETHPMWRSGWKDAMTLFALELDMMARAEPDDRPQRRALIEKIATLAEKRAAEAPRFTR